jgi:hypothetical protein
MLFDREVVEAIEAGDKEKARAVASLKYPGAYLGGLDDGLAVEWVPVGTQFKIEEYDGYESVQIAGDIEFHTA